VVSVAEHTGWAHVVCVAARDDVAAVVERRRVTLIDPGLPTQPYEHDTGAMRVDEADALIARVRKSIAGRSSLALQRLVAELAPGHTVVALAIREPPFPDLPGSVAAVRRSYRLTNSADGMMYHLAICRAARLLELDVQLCRRGQEVSRAAAGLGVAPEEIEEFVTRSGRPAGPPWTAEHQRAFAAGIAVLAAYARKRLTIPV
jgi:hypothetical protein